MEMTTAEITETVTQEIKDSLNQKMTRVELYENRQYFKIKISALQPDRMVIDWNIRINPEVREKLSRDVTLLELQSELIDVNEKLHEAYFEDNFAQDNKKQLNDNDN